MMEETFSKVEEITDTLKEYIQVRLDEVKLEVAEKSSKVVANLFARIMVILAIFFFLVFASIALGYVLGQWWGNMWLGFLAVSGLYLILAWIIWSVRDRALRMPMMNSILGQLTKKDGDDD